MACNAGGPRCLKYGVTGDYVMALEAVLADGQVLRTGNKCIKNVTGYDLVHLLIGSEGTLALITEVTVRLLPKPVAKRTALAIFADIEKASVAVNDILLAGVDVERAQKGITGARSRYFPQISLVGGLSHEEGGFAEGDEILSATIHAEWLVWEWGSNYYEVKREKSRLLQARARKTQTKDLVELGVREAFIALQGAREAIEVARVGVDQAEENYRITEEQFQESIATSQEVLDAQTGLSQAQVNYYEALNTYNIAIARLEKAMGVLQEPKADGDGAADPGK